MKKWLCEFEVDKPVKVEKSKEGKDADGNEIKISRTLQKKEPIKFKLQKPTRRQFEDGELYYAVKLSEGIRAGLLTTAQVAKRYENDGGVYTDAEKARLRELRNDIAELQSQYFKLENDGSEEEKSKEQEEKVRILSQINDCRNEISDIENIHQYIYDQTAEVKARNKTILWWILQLSHQQENGNVHKFDELFGKSEDLEDRLDLYDKMEDLDDNFTSESLKKLAYYVSYWYVSKNVSEDDFKTVESLYAQSSDYVIIEDVDEEEEAEKAAKAKAAEEAKAAKEAEAAKEKAKVAKEEAKTAKAAEEKVAEEAKAAEEKVAEEKAERDALKLEEAKKAKAAAKAATKVEAEEKEESKEG